MNEGNATTNTILVILLVIIVGFVVWYMTASRAPETQEEDGASLELNFGGSNENDNNQPQQN